jgi:2-methylcitrate dehydratase PrpD
MNTQETHGDESGFTSYVASAAAAVRYEELSDVVRERARHALLDWLGVTIAGASEDSAVIVRSVIDAEGGDPVASMFGTLSRGTARQAALANGVAGHALDFDDGTPWATAHPSVPVLSGVMALAEQLNCSGAAALEAAVAGYQAMVLVGCAAGRGAYDRGFHATGTFGTFGATAGCGRLLGLHTGQLHNALGLAATQAAGLRISFGSMAKHLNAGQAAANGVLAAQLAAAGFSGPVNGIEAPLGFMATHNPNPDGFRASRVDKVMQGRLAVESIIFKRYACCAATHSTIESIRSLRRLHGFTADKVATVMLRVPGRVRLVCPITEPVTGAQAKFSLPYAAALALDGRDAGPEAFQDGVTDPLLTNLCKLVEVVWDDGLGAREPTHVTVTLSDGSELQANIDAEAIAEDGTLPVQWDILVAKFTGLISPTLGPDRARTLIDMVGQFEALPTINELVKLATL